MRTVAREGGGEGGMEGGIEGAMEKWSQEKTRKYLLFFAFTYCELPSGCRCMSFPARIRRFHASKIMSLRLLAVFITIYTSSA